MATIKKRSFLVLADGRCQQIQAGKLRMLRRFVKAVVAVNHIGKGYDRQIRHSECDIQISQTNIRINT